MRVLWRSGRRPRGSPPFFCALGSLTSGGHDHHHPGARVKRVVPWLVVQGVWWALLVDCLGNWDGQGHPECWVPIIQGVFVVLLLTTAAMIWALVKGGQ